MKKIFALEFFPELRRYWYLLGRKQKKTCLYLIYIFCLLPFRYSTCQNNHNWILLGLQNEEITAIQVDWDNPNVIYAGSTSNFSNGKVGGIFKSTNAGSSWDTLLRGVTIRDIDIHPLNSQTIYATLGINSLTQAGILKTTDGGLSWFRSDSTMTLFLEEGPSVLEIDRINPNTIYAGTGGVFGGKPFKSVNGAVNWFRIDPDTVITWKINLCGDSILIMGYILRNSITSIAINSMYPDTVYIGSNDGTIYLSPDGGLNWELTCFPLRGLSMVRDIEMNKIDPKILFVGTSFIEGYPNGLFKTKDGGLTFYNPTFGLPDSFNIVDIEIAENQNDSEIFLYGSSFTKAGIYFCKDGETWDELGDINTYINVLEYSDRKLYAGGTGLYTIDVPTTNSNEKNVEINNYLLCQNYPNPFNGLTNFSYQVPFQGIVTLEIIDLFGRKVKSLINKNHVKGIYNINWNGRNEMGTPVSSGVYLYYMKADHYSSIKKLIIIK